jgi:hypothetical protein
MIWWVTQSLSNHSFDSEKYHPQKQKTRSRDIIISQIVVNSARQANPLEQTP